MSPPVQRAEQSPERTIPPSHCTTGTPARTGATAACKKSKSQRGIKSALAMLQTYSKSLKD
jgi:hypothetical protein